MSEINKIISKNFIIKAFISFIIIIAGTFIGIVMGNALGLTTSPFVKAMVPDKIHQETSFILQEKFPIFNVTNNNNQIISLSEILRSKKTLLCFVTNGCEACLKFVDDLKNNSKFSENPAQVVLLTTDVQFFRDNYSFSTYEINTEILDKYNLYRTPTIIGIDQEQTIKFIHPAYLPVLNSNYIKLYL